MKTQAQRAKVRKIKVSRFVSRHNTSVINSKAFLWESHDKQYIYLRNIRVNATCYLEALDCGMSVVRFSLIYDEIDEQMADSAVLALINELGIKSKLFKDIVEALKAAGGRILFKIY